MNELWFKIEYLPYIKSKKITMTVREGKRDHFHPKGYKIGEKVLVRCFDSPGVNEFQAIIIISDLFFYKIKDLKEEYLIGTRFFSDSDLKQSS